MALYHTETDYSEPIGEFVIQVLDPEMRYISFLDGSSLAVVSILQRLDLALTFSFTTPMIVHTMQGRIHDLLFIKLTS